jgi:hypothetical protein
MDQLRVIRPIRYIFTSMRDFRSGLSLSFILFSHHRAMRGQPVLQQEKNQLARRAFNSSSANVFQ